MNKYKIFEGYDHFNNKPLYKVVGATTDVDDYIGEWHDKKSDAEEELNSLNKSKYEQGGSTNMMNFNEFTLSQLESYVKAKGEGDIQVSVSTGNNINSDGTFTKKIPNKSVTNSVFSIGDSGKQIDIYKGSENIYADLVVYDQNNKIYTISLFSKENQKGLKSIVNSIIEKYEQGGSTDNKHQFTYMMLSRLKMDNDAYLGGVRAENGLWALSVDGQIEKMKELWNSLPENAKPEWLSYEDILEYERKMKNNTKMAKGGFVGKGEMVWKNMSASERTEFLQKNFTPEITPRSQQTLVGKDYNFLPKNVKIKIESMYANVDSSENKGSTSPETQKKIKGLEAVIANKNIDQKFRDKAKVELDRIMADVEKVETKVEKAVEKAVKPTTKPQRKVAPKKKPMPKAPEKKIKDIDLSVAKAVEPKGGAKRVVTKVAKPKFKVGDVVMFEDGTLEMKIDSFKKGYKGAFIYSGHFVSKPSEKFVESEKDLVLAKTPKRTKKTITSTKRKKAAMVDVPSTNRGLAADKKREALPVGKRTSAAGNTYYEYRRNRADRNAKRKFAHGGGVDDIMVGDTFVDGVGNRLTITAINKEKGYKAISKDSHSGAWYSKNGLSSLKKMAHGGSTYQGVGEVKSIKKGDRVKDKYGIEGVVYNADGEKIEVEYKSGATFTYRQKDFDNGEIRFLWADRDIYEDEEYAHGGEIDNYVVTNGEMFLSNRGGKFILTDNVEMAYTYSKKEAEQQVKHAESLSKDNSKFKVESFSMYNKYAKGGKIRSKSALAKDRKYTSDEPHELRYRFVRKSKVKRYDTKMAKGGEMEKLTAQTYTGKDAISGNINEIAFYTAENGTIIQLVSVKDGSSVSGEMYYVTINGRGLYAREYREDAYELYRDEKAKYNTKMANGGGVGEYLIYNSSDKKLVEDYLKSKKYKKQYREDFDNVFNLKIIEVPYEKFTDYRLIATKKTAK